MSAASILSILSRRRSSSEWLIAAPDIGAHCLSQAGAAAKTGAKLRLLTAHGKCSNPAMTVIERIVGFCCRWPWAVIAVSLLIAGAGAFYTQQNFAMNTDSEQLIDAKVGWRMRQ